MFIERLKCQNVYCDCCEFENEQGYGMTEAGVVSMCLGFAKRPLKFKSGSCGSVVRNSQIKVVDLKTGVLLSRNHVGEIFVKSDAVMKGN